MKQLFESIWNMEAGYFLLVVLFALALILTPAVWWFVRVRNHRRDLEQIKNGEYVLRKVRYGVYEKIPKRRADFDEQRRRVKEEMAKARGKML